MSIDNRHDIPKVSYSTALDYFVGTCFAFVLATIIQFAGVHFFTKHGSGEIQHDSDSEDSDDEDDHQVRVSSQFFFCLNRNKTISRQMFQMRKAKPWKYKTV